MKKIFVGNLSWKVTEEILKPLFEAYGNVVSVKIIKDHYTERSRGFGFVEMDEQDAATKAIDELNGKKLLERDLRVSFAQERERTGREGGGGGGGGGGGFRGERSESGFRGERSEGGFRSERSEGGGFRGERSEGGGFRGERSERGDRGSRHTANAGERPYRSNSSRGYNA